jgi:hypothetical protein
MLMSEVKDINTVVTAKFRELFGSVDYEYKLIFGPTGEFLGVEAGKCFVEADQLDLAFV